MARRGMVAIISAELVSDAPAETSAQRIRLLESAVAATGGEIVRATDDSLVCAYHSAAEALDGAIAMEQLAARRESPDARWNLRMGITVGDATFDHGEWSGTPLVEADRLRTRADAGQIVATPLVGALAGSLDDHDWIESGDALLVAWASPQRGGAGAPKPGRSTLVGREAEFDTLLAAWKDALSGYHRAVLLVGEPGMGKTRLANELIAAASADDAIAISGRFEHAAAPLLAFSRLLEHRMHACPPAELRIEMGPDAAELARLVPALASVLGDLPAPVHSDGAAQQSRLFAAFTSAMNTIAAKAPLLIVIDDLQLAGPTALAMFRHLIDHCTGSVLVLGVCNEAPVELDSDVLALVRLGGLDDHSVAALVTAAIDDEEDGPPAEVSTALHWTTGGNPLYVGEMLCDWAEGAPWLANVTGLDEVVRRRFNRCPEATRQELLVGAIRRRPTRDFPEAPLDTSHDEIADAILSTLSAEEVRRLHRVVARAIAAEPDADVFALADHYATGAVPFAAADFGLEAARRAREQAAFAEAVSLAARAVAILERAEAADLARRCDLLTEQARSLSLLFDYAARSETAMAAATDARRLSDGVRMAEAALVRTDYPDIGVAAPEVPELVIDTVAALGDERPDLRGLLLARLSEYYVISDSRPDRARELAVEACATVEGLAADVRWPVLAQAAYMLLGTPRADDRLDFAHQIERLVDVTRDEDAHLRVLMYRASAALQLGDLATFDECVPMIETVRLADAQMTYYWWRTLRALMRGEFDEAVDLAAAPLRGQRVNRANALNGWAAQTLAIHRERGRMAEFVPLVEAAVSDNPTITGFRAALALAYIDIGDHDGARRELDTLRPDGFAAVQRDQQWLTSLAILAEVTATVRDLGAAAALYELLMPFAGHVVVVSYGVFAYGAADRYLGMLAATIGRLDAAAAHYASAAELEARLGAQPWLVRTLLWHGRLLHDCGDTESARTFLDAALVGATELGMSCLAEDATSALVALPRV